MALFFLPQLLLAKEADQKIILYVGESRRVPLNGTSAFVADEDIVGVQETLSGQTVLLSGLRVGTTQLYFHQGEKLSYKTIEVQPAMYYTPQSLQPSFNPGRPYLQYSFGNSSTFSQDAFFATPAYAHALSLTLPTASGRILSYGTFSHNDTERSLSSLYTSLETGGTSFEFGNVGSSVAQLLSAFGSASLLGSKLGFHMVSGRTQHQLGFFGGFDPPGDYLDFSLGKQRYGLNYLLTLPSGTSHRSTFINTSFFAFQPTDSDTFDMAGIIEGNVNLKPNISLGAAYGRGSSGGSAFRLRPLYLTEKQITQIDYSFTQHGLRGMDTILTTSDTHSTQFASMHISKNNRTTVSYNLFHTSVLPFSSTGASSHSLGSGFSVSNALTNRKNISLSYGTALSFSDGDEVLGNSLGTAYSRSVGENLFFSHGVSYFRTDLAASTQGVSFDNGFELSTENILYYSNLTNTLNQSDSVTTSMNLTNGISATVSKYILNASLSYSNPDLSAGQHIIIFSPAATLPLTTTRALTLSGGLFYDLSQASQLIGALNLQYQAFFGPGVVSDPLWKQLVGKGSKSNVSGHVFLDKNYNSFLNKSDAPLPKVRLVLDNKNSTLTDAKGYFIFKNVKAGDHTLVVDQKSFENSPALTEPVQVVAQQSFTSVAQVPVALPIPVTYARATLRVQYRLDINNNGKADLEDKLLQLNKGYVILPDGEKRDVSLRAYGGAIIGGIEKGLVKIGFDFLDLPENIENLGPNEQKVMISEYEEYLINFLFRPVRSIRGQIQWPEGKTVSRNLVVILGRVSSRVDSQGYYWLKNIPPGDYDMKVQNLPRGYCLDSGYQTHYTIPGLGLALTQGIPITQKCDTKEKP